MATGLVPTTLGSDTTLRVKILDACGLTCTFCHNEGTAVAADNRHRRIGEFTTAGPSGRRSIYAASNGAVFLAAPIPADRQFGEVLRALRDALALTEVHLTGGEPTLHPDLAGLTKIAVDAGLRVAVTSNGENGEHVLPACANAGLDRVNFSIFGTTPEELAAVQHTRFRNQALAERKIDALRHSITACVTRGVGANANIVVPDHGHAPRVHRLLDEYSPHLSVRLLNSLDHGSVSIQAIERILNDRGAILERRHLTAGVSGARSTYRLPDGRQLHFKQIRNVRLPDTCQGCRFNNDADCHEGFYGVRLYRDRAGRYQVGVCIQRMDLCLPVEKFLTSPLRREILDLRDTEYHRLAQDCDGNIVEC